LHFESLFNIPVKANSSYTVGMNVFETATPSLVIVYYHAFEGMNTP